MFLIGEALVGDGAELAHIDLMIGDKMGPVGTAFANGLTQLSAGHTPLLGVIRPNLLPKPAVLIVPKVTLKHTEQVTQIFGPAQAAVSKAVADALEDGVFTGMDVDDVVIVASVFISPEANYGIQSSAALEPAVPAGCHGPCRYEAGGACAA